MTQCYTLHNQLYVVLNSFVNIVVIILICCYILYLGCHFLILFGDVFQRVFHFCLRFLFYLYHFTEYIYMNLFILIYWRCVICHQNDKYKLTRVTGRIYWEFFFVYFWSLIGERERKLESCFGDQIELAR